MSRKAKTAVQCAADHRSVNEGEAGLRLERDRLRTILNALSPHSFVGLLTRDGLVLEANASVLDATGLKFVDCVGQPFDRLACWAYSEAVQAQLRAAMQRATAGVPSRFDVQVRTHDSRFIWIDFSLCPAYDARGAITHLVPSGVVIDERKRAEATQQESERRFRQMADSIHEVFWLADTEQGQILYVSPGYERIWGRSIEALYASPRLWMDAIHEDDQQRVQLAHQFSAYMGNYELEYRIVRPDGAIRWIHARKFGICDDTGRVYRIAGIAHDVTDRKHAEQQQAEFENRLHHTQKLQALGTLAGGIANDFSNVLTVILGHTLLAAEDLPSNHPVQERLAIIASAAQRASQVVQQIVTFSRPRDRIERQVGQVHAAIQDALELLRLAVPASMQIQTEFAADLPDIEMNAGQIHQIIMNLGTNAAYALEGKAGTLELRTDSVRLDTDGARNLPELEPGEYVRVTVRDTGCGMDPATLARAFEPFFTTKPADLGTGLGLSVVHGIMKAHGGAVTVHSQPGLGSVFALYFPVARTASPQAPQPGGKGVQTEGEGVHVLCVDNDEPVTYLITQILNRRGYRVSAFCDPFQAMQAFRLRGAEFDIAVVDMSMPMLSGLELARELLRTRPELPIVLISGSLRDADVDSASRLGFKHCVSKADLLEHIGPLLHRCTKAIPKIRAESPVDGR
jgi:PAS domain S-box-containing protein